MRRGMKMLLSLLDPKTWTGVFTEPSTSGKTVNAQNALTLSTVWSCVRLVAGTISSLPLVVYEDAADGSRSKFKGHPLYQLLQFSPNADQTALDFWQFMCVSLELWGNAFARIDRGAGNKIVALTPRDDVYKYVVDRFGGENNGKPLVLEAGLGWQSIQLSSVDAQMIQSRQFSVEDGCRWFGVPPHMVGHTTNSTSWGTGLEQQTLGFLIFTLRERLKRIEQAIMKQLLTPAERLRIVVEFNFEGLLRADSAARAAFYSQMVQNGIMTRNEVRRLENLPPIAG
ncbi:hypothetical protein A4X03_0g9664, partial [Tilletia caries]